MQLQNYDAVTTCCKEMCWVHDNYDAVTTSCDLWCIIMMQDISDAELFPFCCLPIVKGPNNGASGGYLKLLRSFARLLVFLFV